MLDILLNIVLLNMPEALFILIACMGFSFGKYGKARILLSFILLTLIIYLLPMIIIVPIVPQIMMVTLSAIVIAKNFNKNLYNCIFSITICVIAMIVIEVVFYIIVSNVFSIEIFTMPNSVDRFLISFPARICELGMAYIINKYNNIIQLEAVNMKFWLLGKLGKKKESEKETKTSGK